MKEIPNRAEREKERERKRERELAARDEIVVSCGYVSDSFSVSITFSVFQRLASSNVLVQRGTRGRGR